MGVVRKVKRVGGSLGVLLPRDIAEAMEVEAGSDVRITLVGRQVVIEPVDDTIPPDAFRRALATVLRKHAPLFERLAAYDRGELPRRRR